MSRSKLWAVAAAVVLGLSAVAANADDSEKFWQTLSPDAQAALKEHWEGMSPEEQADYVQNAKDRRAKFDSLSPEKQAAIQGRREERRKEWANMSEDERRAVHAGLPSAQDRSAGALGFHVGRGARRVAAAPQRPQRGDQDKTPEERQQLKERLQNRKNAKTTARTEPVAARRPGA